jgi:hypothetical protein
VIQDQSPDGRAPARMLRRLERRLLRLLFRVERLGAGRLKGYHAARQTSGTMSESIPQLRIGTTTSASDGDRLRQHALDILVCVGGLSSDADLARRAAGVPTLAVRFGGGTGAAPGFPEVLARAPTSEFTIERLPDDLHDGVVLFSGTLNTAPLYAQNAGNLLRKSAVFTHGVLEAMARDGLFPVSGKAVQSTTGPARAAPRLADQLTYVGRTLAHFLERSTRRLAGTRWRWGVAYQFTENPLDAEPAKSVFIENPPHRYFADPCVATHDGRSVCFVEDYDCRTSRARITAIELGAGGYRELGVALSEPFHLSFPFVFNVGEDLYMCPETAEAREVRLYRCTDFPLKWELHRVLMRDVAAVDSCIAFHDGAWWLFSNIDSAEIGDYRSELHLFRADTFDSDSWQPHDANPVRVDSMGGRNGGLFSAGGALYRVGQVHGFDVYGESMRVMRITELTQARYAEEEVATIRPDFLPGIVGTHTLSWDAGVLALDYVRRERCRTSSRDRSPSSRARRS